MAKLKQSAEIIPLSIKFDGGLNLSAAEWSIADNESPRMLNWYFNPESQLPEVRPGTECQTASAAGSSIRALYCYEKSTTIKYIIGAYGSKLYYLSGTGLTTWTEIGSLASASVVPEFLTFNSKLLIADGGTNIKTWDGTTYGSIATSPNASCLKMIKNRVAANHVNEPDSIYLSKPNDETDWNTAGDAIGLKAGYGDNMAVNGLEVFGDDLIISKKGKAKKKLYRLNTEEITTSYWYVKDIPGLSCAQSERSICTAFNNVFFFDDDGLRSLKGVTEYGDLQADQTGAKINAYFNTSYTCNFLKYIPVFNSIWLSVGGRIFTCRMVSGVASFTELYFNQGRIDSICMDSSTIYLGGNNGYLYKIDFDSDVDETAPDVSSGYLSVLDSKKYNLGASDITIRKTTSRITPITSGSLSISIIRDGTPVNIDTITIESEGEYLYDATGYVYDGTGYIYDSGGEPSLHISHDKIKSSSVQYEIQATGVRFGIDAILAEVMSSRGTY